MALTHLIAALSMVSVAQIPSADQGPGAPPGGPATRYCLRVEPVTGSRIERIECWTREEWAEQGVNVDRDWAKEGVRVLA